MRRSAPHPGPPHKGEGEEKGHAGFTLLEVLVALVVFGLLLAGLTQGVHLGLTAWRLQTRSIEAGADLDAVDRILRQLLTELEPGRPIDPPNIEGSQTRLVFTSALPMAMQAGPRRADMELLVVGGRLTLRSSPHMHARRLTPAPPPKDTVLLQNVARIELNYWDDGVWKASWQGHNPPLLVRVRLFFARGDPRRWPDMVVAPIRRGASR